MTPEDLSAIRADLSVRFDPIATALLAEVDRLTAELSMSPMADDLAVWADRKRILARVDKIPKTPYYAVGEEAEMCPNCVTPWKCNGPHEPTDREPSGYEVPLAVVRAAIEDA